MKDRLRKLARKKPRDKTITHGTTPPRQYLRCIETADRQTECTFRTCLLVEKKAVNYAAVDIDYTQDFVDALTHHTPTERSRLGRADFLAAWEDRGNSM